MSREHEEEAVKNVLRDLGVPLNHNYFRAEKGFRPALHKIFHYSSLYLMSIARNYYLTFTDDQLIIFKAVGLQGNAEDYITKIKYEDIRDFSAYKTFIKYCIQFKYGNKQYYFYIDADGSYSFTGTNTSNTNFHLLREKNFMGLLNK